MRSNSSKYAIMDAGKPLKMYNEAGELQMTIGRYGVWELNGNTLTKCIDTGTNLAKLKKQYNTNIVVKMNTSK